jgi:methylated-DNA-[protein]-cysteine S-methyltransferase
LQVHIRNVEGVWFGFAWEGCRAYATSFSNDQNIVLKNLKEALHAKENLEITQATSSFAEHVFSAIKSVYDGTDTSLKIPLVMEHLPVYTQRVLRTVSRIPVGYVTPYGTVAEAAGGGARAVGNVMASNPFAPLVPCHRVVSAGLGLGGYGGGLLVKYEFLKRERRGFTEPKDVAIEGWVLRVFPVEFVLQKLQKTVIWGRP